MPRVGVLAGLALLTALFTAPCGVARPGATRHLAPPSSPAPDLRTAGSNLSVVSQPLATQCATGKRAVASFTQHTGLHLLGARVVQLPSASDFLLAKLDKDGDGGVSLEELTKHLELCCAGQGPHALELAVRMFLDVGIEVGDVVQAVSSPSTQGVVVEFWQTRSGVVYHGGGPTKGPRWYDWWYWVRWEDGTKSGELWPSYIQIPSMEASLTRKDLDAAYIISARAICLAMCQTDASCDCVSADPDFQGCFFATHPCETVVDPDGAMFAKTAVACLKCPSGGATNGNGTCVCDSDAVLSFARVPKCTDSDPAGNFSGRLIPYESPPLLPVDDD